MTYAWHGTTDSDYDVTVVVHIRESQGRNSYAALQPSGQLLSKRKPTPWRRFGGSFEGRGAASGGRLDARVKDPGDPAPFIKP